MSWYTQYRPRRVKELHLSSVREQLQSYMKAGSFPQVFLFAGPKGTGKTSASRILGAMFNDSANAEVVEQNFFNRPEQKSKKSLSYVEPDSDNTVNQSIFMGKSYVVQELDAASNRGIDDVRALKDRVQMPPQDGKIAVYILDEAHMLTTEAFNALLKLLEEPPAHAVFILATTEHHKIPATVLSRTAEVQFRKATSQEIIDALNAVLDQVGLSAETQVLQAIVEQANGSFRDAVKLLEQVATGSNQADTKKITMESVKSLLQGYVGDDDIIKLLSHVVAKDAQAVAQQLAELRSQDIDAISFYSRVVSVLHESLLQSLEVADGDASFSKQISLFLLEELQDLSAQQEIMPLLQLEVKLLSIIDRASAKHQQKGSGGSSNSGKSSEQPQATSKRLDEQDSIPKRADTVHSALPIQDTVSSPEETELPSLHIPLSQQTNPLKSDSLAIPDHVDSTILLKEWTQFVDLVADKNKTIAALLRSAKPLIEKSNGIARVQVFYTFHRDQLMQPKFMQLLQDCAKDMTGHYHQFEFEIGKDTPVTNEVSSEEPVTALVQELIM